MSARATVRFILLVGVAAAFSLTFAGPASADCAGASLTYSASNQTAMEKAVVCLVNDERMGRGLPQLQANSKLREAAFAHSKDMADNNYFDHDSLDGRKFFERITSAGYSWTWAGENIAAGQPTPNSVVESWMASKGHCENILSGDYSDIGVGVAKGLGTYGIYWTQDFGNQDQFRWESDTGCPYKPSGHTTGPGSFNCNAVGVKITSLQRAAGGRVRVAGRAYGSVCCPTARITVKRGKRSESVRRKLCSERFVYRVKLPRGSGNAKVTVKLVRNGKTSRRTLKL